MIVYRSKLILSDNGEKEIETRSYEEWRQAEGKIRKIIEDNAGKRCLLDVSNPAIILIAVAIDPDKEMTTFAFEGSEAEMKPLRLFAIRCKSEVKRRENLSSN